VRLFGDWLSRTRSLQEGAYGVTPSELQGEDWTEYARWNVLYANVELAEALQAVKGAVKPWSVYHGRRITEEERLDAVEECVDALHFIANFLCALGSTDEELSRMYEAKMKVNEDRQRSGEYGG